MRIEDLRTYEDLETFLRNWINAQGESVLQVKRCSSSLRRINWTDQLGRINWDGTWVRHLGFVISETDQLGRINWEQDWGPDCVRRYLNTPKLMASQISIY